MALAAAPALTIGGPPRVNLLPRAVTASRQRASLLRTWLLGLLAALGVVLVATGGAYALQLTAQQSLDQANADTVRLLGEVAALQPVNEKLKLESELGDYRTQAMGTDLTWATLVSSVESALPADTVLAGFTLVPGGNPVGDDPALEIGAAGELTITSTTPTQIVDIVRALRTVPGILSVDGWESTTDTLGYSYLLRILFDQSSYTGAFAEEAGQ
ncbi:hypothetical protein [Microbacterium aurum]|uniref:hypothetical protein n=1 Tax=Microbacterium aurum TaxID=36805 RepID=UPI0028E85C34|nr:hypothetical protein [Microbacterium aurum]